MRHRSRWKQGGRQSKEVKDKKLSQKVCILPVSYEYMCVNNCCLGVGGMASEGTSEKFLEYEEFLYLEQGSGSRHA